MNETEMSLSGMNWPCHRRMGHVIFITVHDRVGLEGKKNALCCKGLEKDEAPNNDDLLRAENTPKEKHKNRGGVQSCHDV